MSALENASEAFAKEPVPMMVLKSNGTNLTSERIGKLLEAWRVARSTRSLTSLVKGVFTSHSLFKLGLT